MHETNYLQASPKNRPWREEDDKALVEYIALYHCTEKGSDCWPQYQAEHPLWTSAAKYVHDTTGDDLRRCKYS